MKYKFKKLLNRYVVKYDGDAVLTSISLTKSYDSDDLGIAISINYSEPSVVTQVFSSSFSHYYAFQKNGYSALKTGDSLEIYAVSKNDGIALDSYQVLFESTKEREQMRKYKASVIVEREMNAVDYAKFLKEKIDIYTRAMDAEKDLLEDFIERKQKKIDNIKTMVDKKMKELAKVISENNLNKNIYSGSGEAIG